MSIDYGRRCGRLGTCVSATANVGCEHQGDYCTEYVNTGIDGFMDAPAAFFGKRVSAGLQLNTVGIFANAGLTAGDILTDIDNYDMTSDAGIDALADFHNTWTPGSILKVYYLHGGNLNVGTLTI